MSWNNSKERKAFVKREQEMMEEYRKAGMSEEKIREMYEFDLEVFKGDRAYYEHTCPLVQEESKVAEDNTIVGLMQGEEEPTCFVEDMTASNDWIDEIEDEALARAIRRLSPERQEILRLIAVEAKKCIEIAAILGVSHQAVTKQIREIRLKLGRMTGRI